MRKGEVIGTFPVAADEVVNSLDDMQPVPRAGKFFATRILREEVRTGAGVILQEGDDPNETDMRTMRARVDQLGRPRVGERWDIEVGWEVVLPYHAGHTFSWMSQTGITETLLIVDTQEIIAIFRPRGYKDPSDFSEFADFEKDIARYEARDLDNPETP